MMRLVTTITSDGLHLSGLLSEPETKAKAIIIHIHGMGGDPYSNEWYEHFHTGFSQHGISFLSVQHRGTGSITQFYQEPGEYLNYGNAFELVEDCVYDIQAWVEFAKEQGYKDICLSAHSLAPSKVVYYMNQKTDPSIKGLIFVSPVDMVGIGEATNEDFQGMMEEAKNLMQEGKEYHLLSQLESGEYYLSAKTFLNLFAQSSPADVFCYTDRNHDWSALQSISVPVFGIFGTADSPITTICDAQNAAEAFKTHSTSAAFVQTIIYEDASHAFDGFEQDIVRDVELFITEHCTNT